MKTLANVAVMLGIFTVISISATAIAGVTVESDGHHHLKLHVAKGYYISHEKLEELCHESKEEIEHHATAALHKVDGSHDGHNQKVTCDGGHSLETVHDAH